MKPDDHAMAERARLLAQALSSYARSREDEDRKRVAQLQTELCAAWRAEAEAIPEAVE